MSKPRTHFEQVPLKIIEKIIGEQTPPEVLIQEDKATRNKKPKKSLLPTKQQSKADYRKPSAMDLIRQ